MPYDRAPIGNTFSNSVYRDGTRLVLSDSSITGAVSLTPILTVAAVNALETAARGGTLNGFVDMGPADGVIVTPLVIGADNSLMTLSVSGLNPIIEGGLIVAFHKILLAQIACTAGATTLGSDAAIVTGLATTDRACDVLTNNFVGGAFQASSLGDIYARSAGTAAGQPSFFALQTQGAKSILIEASNNGQSPGADGAKALVHRFAGGASPAPSGP